MNEMESTSGNERNTGWKWAAIVLGALLVISCVCLVSAVWGGVIGFNLGRGRGRSAPMPGYPFDHPMVPTPRFEPWPPEMPEPPRGFEGQAWLGVTFATTREGAEITSVIPDSPADQAGVRVGDVITAVNDEPVTPQRPLDEHIHRYDPGTSVELTVLRNARERSIEVRLGMRAIR
ncbi:MAG: S1C family serine protease [Anaerolineae bacterium]